MSRSQQDQFIDDDEEDEVCPLCVEEFDLTDKNFRPCPCGYQICQFCFNNIRTTMNGLCPACRRPYDDKNIQWKVISHEEMVQHKHNLAQQAKKKAAQKQKEAQKREADNLSRKHLAGLRVRQKNLVYVTGMKPKIQGDRLVEALRGKEYFGQYGEIIKIVVSKAKDASQGLQPVGVYVTFARKEDAALCIECINSNPQSEGRVRAQYGTTKYCSAYLRGETCNNRSCMFLHEPGEQNESFTRQDLSSMNAASSQQPSQQGSHSHPPPTQSQPASLPPQPQPPVPQPAHPQLQHEEPTSPVESNADAPALPTTANWAAQARRPSQATSSSAFSASSAAESVEPEEPSGPASRTRRSQAEASPFDDLLKKAFNPDIKWRFNYDILSDEDRKFIDIRPPMWDPDGGARRRAAKQQEQEAELRTAAREPEETAESGSMQLGGEPDDQKWNQQQAIQPPATTNFGLQPSLGDDLAGLGNGRVLTPTQAQQQQLLMQLKMGSVPHQPTHGRQPSRFSFTNDATSIKKLPVNGGVYPHQPIGGASTGQYYSGVQGPPPGLKTSTPPVSGGGMFGQGHGFTAGYREDFARGSQRGDTQSAKHDLLPALGQIEPPRRATPTVPPGLFAIKPALPLAPSPVEAPEVRAVPESKSKLKEARTGRDEDAEGKKDSEVGSWPGHLVKRKNEDEEQSGVSGVEQTSKSDEAVAPVVRRGRKSREAAVPADALSEVPLTPKKGTAAAASTAARESRKENKKKGKKAASSGASEESKGNDLALEAKRPEPVSEPERPEPVPEPAPEVKPQKGPSKSQARKQPKPIKIPISALGESEHSTPTYLSQEITARSSRAPSLTMSPSRPSTPAGTDSPLKRVVQPRTLRITDMAKSEAPPATPSASAPFSPVVAPKVASRRASITQPGTPMSERLDGFSLPSTSVSRASSPPPVGRKAEKKRARKLQKQNDVDAVATAAQEAAEVHAPILARKTKSKKKTSSGASTSAPEVKEATEPAKLKEKEQAPPVKAKPASPAPTTPVEPPQPVRPVSPEQKTSPGKALSAAELLRAIEGQLPLSLASLSLFQMLNSQSHLRRQGVEPFNSADAQNYLEQKRFEVTPAIEAQLREGKPVCADMQDGRLSGRIMITPQGTRLSCLTAEEEARYLALEQVVNNERNAHGALRWGGADRFGKPGQFAGSQRDDRGQPVPRTLSEREAAAQARFEAAQCQVVKERGQFYKNPWDWHASVPPIDPAFAAQYGGDTYGLDEAAAYVNQFVMPAPLPQDADLEERDAFGSAFAVPSFTGVERAKEKKEPGSLAELERELTESRKEADSLMKKYNEWVKKNKKVVFGSVGVH